MGSFSGWPDAALDFYRDLERNNNRAFWAEHKDVYERAVKAPFTALSEVVTEFGPLRVFRPNRDVRFSKDKAPYKTRCYAVTEGDGGEAYYVTPASSSCATRACPPCGRSPRIGGWGRPQLRSGSSNCGGPRAR